jgi:hypothetical protein
MATKLNALEGSHPQVVKVNFQWHLRLGGLSGDQNRTEGRYNPGFAYDSNLVRKFG